MVAMDADEKPTEVPELKIETEDDRRAWDVANAMRRKSLEEKTSEINCYAVSCVGGRGVGRPRWTTVSGADR